VWDIGGGVKQVIYAVTGVCPDNGAAVGTRVWLTIPNNQENICHTLN